ncbi:three-helix bundle dimerization domain-containing protein [Mycobacterium sp. C31M]
MSDIAEKKALAEVERTLTQEFPDIAQSVITSAVQQALSRFTESRIRDYVPLFVEKHARRTLAEAADLAESA